MDQRRSQGVLLILLLTQFTGFATVPRPEFDVQAFIRPPLFYHLRFSPVRSVPPSSREPRDFSFVATLKTSGIHIAQWIHPLVGTDLYKLSML